MKARDEYTKTVTVDIPADHAGKSLDDNGVLADVVASGMTEAPGVVENHLRGRYNEVAWALHNGNPVERYEAAVKLAGIALRYAWENRIR
jgi:hypothetical protein